MSKDLVNLINNATGNNALPVAIETVTNSNGTALMFADGTMICLGSATFTGIRNTAITAGGYRTNGVTATYAKQFIERPRTFFQDTTGIAYADGCKISSSSESSVNVTWWGINADTTSHTYNASYMAIGRWKN